MYNTWDALVVCGLRKRARRKGGTFLRARRAQRRRPFRRSTTSNKYSSILSFLSFVHILSSHKAPINISACGRRSSPCYIFILPIMSSPSDIESTPAPAVSSLRSRFEKLAADSSKTATQRPVSSYGLLTTDPPSPRPRTRSGTYDPKPDTHSLRAASSSSDLRTTKIPPSQLSPSAGSSRATSPAPPIPNFQTRPPSEHPSQEVVSVASASTTPLTTPKKPPPPPPPPHPLHSYSDPSVHGNNGTNGVASLINKFG